MKTKISRDSRLEQVKAIDLRDVIPVEDGDRGTNYVYGWCPFHEQGGEKDHKSKSFLVYSDHYLCLSTKCGEHGDIINWFAHKMYGSPRASLKNGAFSTVLDTILGQNLPSQSSQRVKLPPKQPKVLHNDLVPLAEACHTTLLESPRRLAYYLSRGFTLQTVKQEMWGWDGQRYVITVWEGAPRSSELLALRFRARPGEGQIRYSGVKYMNEKLLYNRAALLYAKSHSTPIVVMYGEFDARLSWQYRVPTVSPTNGALSFQVKWLEGFEGDVIFVPDRHEEKAAYQDANMIPKAWVVQLPNGPFKDFTELCQTQGSPNKLWREIYQYTGIRWFKSLLPARKAEHGS